jgi:cytochrome c556
MQTMKLAIFAALTAILVAAPLGLADTNQTKHDEADKPLSVWMEKKMEYSQAMLRGLVSGDLDSVAEKAEQMRVVSRVEGWIRGKKSGYRAQLQVFELTNNEILRQARAGNLEGTTMAFHQLTTSCVSCHKMTREPNGEEKPAESSKKPAE